MKTAPLPALDPLRRYSVPDSLALLQISRKRFYQNVKAGKIPLIKDGRRSYCAGTTIVRLSAEPAA